MMPEFSSVAARPCASRIAFIAMSHGWSLISADTVPVTSLPRTIVRPEYSANVASTSAILASSQVIVIRRCCDVWEKLFIGTMRIGASTAGGGTTSGCGGRCSCVTGLVTGGVLTGGVLTGGGLTGAAVTGTGVGAGDTEPVATFAGGSGLAAGGAAWVATAWSPLDDQATKRSPPTTDTRISVFDCVTE